MSCWDSVLNGPEQMAVQGELVDHWVERFLNDPDARDLLLLSCLRLSGVFAQCMKGAVEDDELEFTKMLVQFATGMGLKKLHELAADRVAILEDEQ